MVCNKQQKIKESLNIPTILPLVLGHSQQSQGQQQLHSPQMQVWNNQHQQPLPNPAITAQLDALTVQQNTLREQITVSEQNLQAQHGVGLASTYQKFIRAFLIYQISSF